MAIWQYQCYIIPKRNSTLNLKQEQITSWKGILCSQKEIDFLDIRKSWSKDIVQYGSLDETCIEFIFEDNELLEIECRIDLRSFSMVVFKKLLNYVKSINAVFFNDGQIYMPIEKDMLEQIKKSDAYNFCKEPFEYLSKI